MRNKTLIHMKCTNCGSKVKNGATFCPNCGNKVSYTSSKTPLQIFKEGCSFHKRHDNGRDLLVFPIAEYNRSAVRNYFNIDLEEEILIIRDTSFWNSRNQGLVLTDKKILVISDSDNINDDTTIYWSWDIISKVEYKDQYLYFFDYQGNHSNIGISYFLKDISDESLVHSVGRQLAELLTKMAKAIEPQTDPIVVAFEGWDNLQNEGKFEEAYQYAKDLQTYDLGIDQWLSFDCAASSAMQQEKYEIALEETNQALQHIEDGNSHIVGLLYRKYSCNLFLGNKNEARKDCLSVLLYAKDEKRADGVLVKDDAKADFKMLEDQYVAEFLEKPYNDRKLLMPVKKYTDLHQEHISVIETQYLPSEIEFPVGHPVANQLYIGHPYLRHKYILFENYQLELVEDKVREFCSFVQKLGATEISIECLNTNSTDTSERGNINISGNAHHKVGDANASYKKDYSRHMIDELTHTINMHQEFMPTQAPILQENMVWFKNEPSWQRLYEQRMSGSLLAHEERIETRKSQMVEGNELSEIRGEVKTLFASAGIEWNKSMNAQYQLQENAILSIKVKFAPMSQLTGEKQQTDSSIPLPQMNQLSINEQEYIDELKECIADGEIGSSERRLLDKLRSKLGISEERAAELEASLCKPQLTAEEQEYLEAYKEVLEDGAISDKERRLLNKLIKMYNISETRAKEIEEMAHK